MRQYFYIYIFFALVFIPGGLSFILGSKNESIENKASTLSKPSPIELQEGISFARMIPQYLKGCKTYFRQYEAYYNDNFLFKNPLVKCYNKIKCSLNTSPNPGQVILGKNGWMYLGNDYGNINGIIAGADTFSVEELAKIKDIQLKIKAHLNSLGIDYYIMICPEKSTIFKEYLPFTVRNERTKSDQIVELFKNTELPIIFPKDELLNKKNDCQTYYKLDSHWNANGAFIAYNQLMDTLNQKHPDLRKFQIGDFSIVDDYFRCERDLSKILTLENQFDNVFYYELINTTIKEQEKRLNDPRIYLEYRFHSNNGSTKKILSFTDSYFCEFRLYLAESFKEFVMCQYNGEPDLNLQIIESERPNIVILETVERSINALLKEPKIGIN